MKYAIVIPDGAGDLPQESLQGRTPFELADCPTFDRVATEGRFGTTRNVPDGLPGMPQSNRGPAHHDQAPGCRRPVLG